MLQTLNIPSSPLPEMPAAPAGAPGDAGERAEFAQLLQQAQAVDGDAALDEPSTRPAKDVRTERRAPTGGAHGAHDPKHHDVPLAAGADNEPLQAACEPSDLVAALHPHDPNTESTAIDAPSPTPAPPRDEIVTLAADATVVPVPWRPAEPLPTEPGRRTADAVAAVDDERSAHARLGARSGAREPRLPARLDAHVGARGDAMRDGPASDIARSPAAGASFELALRATGRSTGAPTFDRSAAEPPAGVTPALALARELQAPTAGRAEAVAEAALHAAPDEPGFAPSFGAQVALWVKDGVQEARLQLHPAELGPVSVQIALDGQAAHVDFTAAVAATRSSIEQSLPALAAALRESGFTLAGGGVFGGRSDGNDSHRERAPDARGQGARGTAAIGGDGGEAVAATPRRWARSLVDVYA